MQYMIEKLMGNCQEVETQRERKGSRTLPGWQGFVLSCSRAMCWGCRSLQPTALGSSLRTWTAPGKTSEGNTGHREVNSRARNLPLASKKEARRPHTQPCSLLSWEGTHPDGQKRQFQLQNLLAQPGCWERNSPQGLWLALVSHDTDTKQKLIRFIFSSFTTHQPSHCYSVWFWSHQEELKYFNLNCIVGGLTWLHSLSWPTASPQMSHCPAGRRWSEGWLCELSLSCLVGVWFL